MQVSLDILPFTDNPDPVKASLEDCGTGNQGNVVLNLICYLDYVKLLCCARNVLTMISGFGVSYRNTRQEIILFFKFTFFKIAYTVDIDDFFPRSRFGILQILSSMKDIHVLIETIFLKP